MPTDIGDATPMLLSSKFSQDTVSLRTRWHFALAVYACFVAINAPGDGRIRLGGLYLRLGMLAHIERSYIFIARQNIFVHVFEKSFVGLWNIRDHVFPRHMP